MSHLPPWVQKMKLVKLFSSFLLNGVLIQETNTHTMALQPFGFTSDLQWIWGKRAPLCLVGLPPTSESYGVSANRLWGGLGQLSGRVPKGCRGFGAVGDITRPYQKTTQKKEKTQGTCETGGPPHFRKTRRRRVETQRSRSRSLSR